MRHRRVNRTQDDYPHALDSDTLHESVLLESISHLSEPVVEMMMMMS